MKKPVKKYKMISEMNEKKPAKKPSKSAPKKAKKPSARYGK